MTEKLELTDKEIKELKEILDQISEVAGEDGVATLMEYEDQEVVITKPLYVKNIISEALEEQR